MIALATIILAAAVLLGSGLAILYSRGPAARPPHWSFALIHGALGAAGFALFLEVLEKGLPKRHNGTAGFGVAAASLLGIALAFGLVIAALTWRRKRSSGILVGAHATVAIAGFVLILALVALG